METPSSMKLRPAWVVIRLEDKGYVKSSMGGATNARGGRRKRIFTITNAGLALLGSMKEARIDLWKMVPQLKFNY
jgi:PadR family transcriptional regulator, regulatory protein PadR